MKQKPKKLSNEEYIALKRKELREIHDLFGEEPSEQRRLIEEKIKEKAIGSKSTNQYFTIKTDGWTGEVGCVGFDEPIAKKDLRNARYSAFNSVFPIDTIDSVANIDPTFIVSSYDKRDKIIPKKQVRFLSFENHLDSPDPKQCLIIKLDKQAGKKNWKGEGNPPD